MEDVKGLLKKWGAFFLILLAVVIAGGLAVGQWSGEGKADSEESEGEPEVAKESSGKALAVEDEQEWKALIAKGYNLPVDIDEREEAETEGHMVMELIADIYANADKGDASNVAISDETILQMAERIGEKGYPVTAVKTYFSMRNYKKVDKFLENAVNGESGAVVLYTIRSDGGISRNKYIYDGSDMYVVTASYSWGDADEAVLTYISYTRMKKWSYSEKGWFCYELCVPTYPEVSEIVDGSNLLRVQPMPEEFREPSEKYVLGLGYQGNNVLYSNWDLNHLDILDYNGLFEYLYSMRYEKRFPSEDYPDGIPKEEFENLIMEYIPVSKEKITKYAVFDEEKQTYTWVRLGCFNYVPTFFGTSVPEVTKVKKNEDGTMTLTVDAVCEMVLCDDAVITHELTLKLEEDGGFKYISNGILNNGMENIPDYQYRIYSENLHKKGIYFIDDIDSIEEINKYMIPEQSFDITLDDWGEVKFVSCEPQKPLYCDYEASFFLIRDEQILYQFPCMYEHNKKNYPGCFDSIGAVAFRDINDDGKKDIIVIFYYYSGAGPTGMIPRPKTRIYLAGENEFYLAEDIIADV